MKTRKQNIDELSNAIAKTLKALANAKGHVTAIEARLDRQRAHLNTQLMLNKFDQIDELRQHISDIIAANKWETTTDGHIHELEANDKI